MQRTSKLEETSTNLVKPSAWATRERKYNADLASLRAQIEAKSEAAAAAAAELQIMQSGAGMEVLQQRLKVGLAHVVTAPSTHLRTLTRVT